MSTEVVRLLVISDYRNRDVFYAARETITVSLETAQFLLSDAPGCFVVLSRDDEQSDESSDTKAFSAPPRDKMIKEPSRKK